MSKLKIALVGLAFLLCLLAPGASSQAGECIDVVAYGTNPETGECFQFPNPCSVPPGWHINYQGCASAW